MPITPKPPSPHPVIAITQGDPAGIGPEICLKAAGCQEVLAVCRPVIIGDLRVLLQAAGQLKLALPPLVLTVEEALTPGFLAGQAAAGQPLLVDCACIKSKIEPGKPTREAGEASYKYITTAIEGAKAGIFGAVTTAPITKTTLKMAGINEPGHTEIFARLTETQNFAMMFYSPRLVVSFVTCHQSLRSVPAALTIEGVHRVTVLTGQTLRRILGREPRLAVLGLNPHAGEEGLFGDEEKKVIAPAIELARREGWRVEGPIPPDAAFLPHALERYDGHVTLYHDQGSIPFKMAAWRDGVNMTMGLPIIRTSVDHGTAYDIAWRGQADPSSLIAAIRLAARLSHR